MIITCPYCHTKYEVADQAIGAAGRKVQCANCHQSWKAAAAASAAHAPKPRIVGGTDTNMDELIAEAAEHDRLFGSDSEAVLDQAFAEEEARVQQQSIGSEAEETEDETGKLDHHLLSRRRRELQRRQNRHVSRLPMARIRRVARFVSLTLLLVLVSAGYFFRTDIVRVYPDLGGLYAMIGLKVNVYGLTFSNVETLRTLRDGDDVTIITAKIRSVVDHTVRVPPILVSILNDDGRPLYEWTASAPVSSISPGDVVGFQTQLMSAPADAAHVRLVFGSSSSLQQAPSTTSADQGAR